MTTNVEYGLLLQERIKRVRAHHFQSIKNWERVDRSIRKLHRKWRDRTMREPDVSQMDYLLREFERYQTELAEASQQEDELTREMRVTFEGAQHRAWMDEHLKRYCGIEPTSTRTKPCEVCQTKVSVYERFCPECREAHEKVRAPYVAVGAVALRSIKGDGCTRFVAIDSNFANTFEDLCEKEWDLWDERRAG